MKISGSVKLPKVTRGVEKLPRINVLNVETDHMEKFQINDLPKYLSPVFRLSTETEYQN